MSSYRSPKLWKSQGDRSGLYERRWSVSQPNLRNLSLARLTVWEGALSCKRMIPSGSILGRFNFMARPSATKKRTTPLALLCLPPFPMLDEHILHYARLQSNKGTTVWTCAFSLCMSPTLQMVVSIHNNSVASFCGECVLWRVFGFHLTAPQAL